MDAPHRDEPRAGERARDGVPVGVILAGGRARRMGGGKAVIELHGRPLIAYPVAAMQAAIGEVVVLAKPDTELPELHGVPVWREPAEPRHPLFGVVYALRCAAPRPVLVCAADMPLVDASVIHRLALGGPPPAGHARLAVTDGESEPLLGRYEPPAAVPLEEILERDPRVSARAAVAELNSELVQLEDADTVFNVNTAADLQRAARLLGERSTDLNRR